MHRKSCFLAVALLLLPGAMAQTPPAPTPPAPPTSPQPPSEQAARAQREADERQRNDWPNLARYSSENAKLGPAAPGENRVVLMGDSITQGWGQPERFFPGKPYFNRGISGQTSPQMLVRFRPDVIALQPKVVVILAGTNDIAGNTGPMTPEMTKDNLQSMVDLARANGIRVVLASVLPAYDFPWRRGLEPGPKIAALNAWIKNFAARNNIVYLDYYGAMVDDKGGLKADLTYDGVHPNAAGYAVMAPLTEKAIAQALESRR